MFLVVEIFVGILFVFACVNLRNSKSSQNSVKLHGNTIDDDEIPVNCSTPIKRRHSHEEKSVYLSDNHIEEIKVSKRRCSLDRKFFLNTTTYVKIFDFCFLQKSLFWRLLIGSLI